MKTETAVGNEVTPRAESRAFVDAFGKTVTARREVVLGEVSVWIGSCVLLTREQVKMIIPALQSFADTGEIPPAPHEMKR